MDDAWLIVNPVAGGGRAARHAGATLRLLTAAGVGCRLVQPTSAEATTSAAREAVAAGARAVIACGGDGTVHAVLQGLDGSTVALGILAGGSGDDIATNLGFDGAEPLANARQLADALVAGTTRGVDLGHATAADGAQRSFVGVLSSGFDSAVNERANRMGRLGGQRYNVAMVRELASFRAVPFVLEADGRQVTGEAMLVAVGNGGTYGGGMRICPQARQDDGLLDITWLSGVSKARFLRAFPSVYSGTHVRFPFVSTYRARHVTISAPGQVAYADGERIGPLPVTVECRPSALRVLSA